jgi:hypothetical protein
MFLHNLLNVLANKMGLQKKNITGKLSEDNVKSANAPMQYATRTLRRVKITFQELLLNSFVE